MSKTLQIAYAADAAPTVVPANLVAAMALVNLDISDLTSFGVTGIVYDDVTTVGRTVTRTVRLSLDDVLFDQLFPPACPDRVAMFRNLYGNVFAASIYSPVASLEPELS